MTRMLGRRETQASRDELRQELHHFLQLNASEPWMWQLMACCCEVDQSDVAAAQAGYVPPLALEDASPSQDDVDGPAVPLPMPAAQCRLPTDVYEALCWSVGPKDYAVAQGLIKQLPLAVVLNKVDEYRDWKSAQADEAKRLGFRNYFGLAEGRKENSRTQSSVDFSTSSAEPASP